MAKVLSSISGNLISAASAGFAPTNSADVSAIASAYQVVSATATQLYAGTAYVTSINSAPLSASRAGNAANASLANSAWYDGTGRLISSLPDSATVSAIAESYAESAASGKLDTTAQVVTATAGDGTYITSINGMGISGQGGGGGSTGDYVEKSAMNVAIGSGNTASADISFAQGSGNSAKYRSFAQGLQNTATAWSVAIGGSNTARSTGAAFGVSNTAFNTSIAVGRQNYASSESLCVGVENAATKCSVALGQYNTAKNTAFSYGRFVSSQNNAFAIGNYNLKGNGDTTTGDSAAFVIGDGTGTAARHDLMLVTKDGEITMCSSTADTTGTGILSAIRAISAAATGGVDSATVSAIASSYANSAASSKLDASAVAFGVNDGDLVVKSISGRPISAKYALYDVNGIYLSSYALSADVSGVIDTVSANSATWGGGGATGDYVEKSAMNVAIGSGNTASADISFAQGSGNSAKYRSFAQGLQNTATAWSVAIGGSNTARSTGAAFGVSNTAFNTSIAVGRQNYASSESLCVGVENAATKCSVALGQYNTAKNTAFSYGRFVSSQNNAFAIGNYNLKGNGDTTTGDSAAFVIGDGTGTAARHDLMLVTKDGEITMCSSTADTTGTGILSAIRAISAAATGGVDSATVSAIASSYANSAASSKLDASAVAFGVNDGDLVVKSISGRPISAKYALYDVNGIYLSSYALSADVSSTIDTVSNNSASWGAGGIDSATCSAIASSYAESAASSKMDTSAMSAYATTAYVTAGLSGKEDEFNAGTGLEFVQSGSDRVLQVEAPVDIVAGPGIAIDNPDGNTLRVSVDQAIETVLWSNDNGAATFTASEVITNFERIAVYVTDNPFSESIQRVEIPMMGGNLTAPKFSLVSQYDSSWRVIMWWVKLTSSDMKSFSISSAGFAGALANGSWSNGNEPNYFRFYKVVGIHRIAGGN